MLECLCETCRVITKDRDLPCPLAAQEPELHARARAVYLEDPLVARVCRAHSRLLGRGSSRWPRAEHIREFCLHMGLRRVGIAVCSMFLAEARAFQAFLAEKDIESAVAACKMGPLYMEDIGLAEPGTGGYKLCNPVAQAEVLNADNTEINVILGLCSPHDLLFTHRSQAPVTTLFAKEHLSGHAPYHTMRAMAGTTPSGT